jgi:hypothetical protein
VVQCESIAKRDGALAEEWNGAGRAGVAAGCKASLSGDFMALLLMHSYFENSAKSLCFHETLIISLFINMVPHQPI